MARGKGRHPGLSANDCFCLVTARVYLGILLTGDALLRGVTVGNGLEVHSVVWVVEGPGAAAVCSRSLPSRALKARQLDETVFMLPHKVSTWLENLAEGDHRAGGATVSLLLFVAL